MSSAAFTSVEVIIWVVSLWMQSSVMLQFTLLLSLVSFRAVMTDGENIGATRLVLEPANLAVYVARNLSPWYHDVPDVDVMGKLHAVKVSCVYKEELVISVY